MRGPRYLPQLIFIALIFLASSCAPAIQATSYPNPLPPVETKTPLATLSLDQTALPTPSFGTGYLANIAVNDVLNNSNEEIVKLLVSQWLEGFKTGMTSYDAIKNYSVDRVTIRSHDASEIIASVIFSIQPVEYSQNWASMVTSDSNSNDPWWHLGATFGIFRDGEYFRLKLLPGWGT